METIQSRLNSALSAARYYAITEEKVLKIADKLGEFSREDYLAFRAQWRSEYSSLSAAIHALKPRRKGGTPESVQAISDCVSKRTDARAFMLVRLAMKETARRNVAAKRALAA